MPSLSTSVNYERDLRPDKTARPAAAGDVRTGARPRTGQAAVEAPVSRPADFPAVEEFLQLLARAVRQFHTYPATSPLCTDAISACHKVLASLDGRDRLACRVTPRELIVDDIGIGAGTIVEHEIVRRLHRSHVAALDIDRSASPRDLSRFSTDVLRCDDLVRTKTTLAELLAEHGVETIAPHLAQRPEMLEVGTPPASRSHLVTRERRRRQALLAAAGPASYLYPPDKGWVRLDPSSIFDTISLVDLAILVDDPADIAAMLLRLTDDEAGAESRDGALQQKFSDVATLLAALDPPLARVMFSKLARAVLDLGPERRTDLLRRTILPGPARRPRGRRGPPRLSECRPRGIAVPADGPGNRGAGTADDRARAVHPVNPGIVVGTGRRIPGFRESAPSKPGSFAMMRHAVIHCRNLEKRAQSRLVVLQPVPRQLPT